MPIRFPKWVAGPSPCKTATFSVVLPVSSRIPDTWHGALRFEFRVPNRPTVTASRIGLPGFYTKLAA